MNEFWPRDEHERALLAAFDQLFITMLEYQKAVLAHRNELECK